MNFLRIPVLCLAGLLLATRVAHAVAGPPLVTDDPGTPGPNNWEINAAFTSESSSSEHRVELPLLDINYGLGDRIQLKYEVPYVISKSAENDTKNSGFDRSDVGVKWRFNDKAPGGVALSTYPQYTFKSPVSESARNADAATYADFLLPVEAEESRGAWDFNQELGFRWLNQNQSQWVLGLALTYNVKETFVLLGELHEQATDTFGDSELLANVGTELALNGKVNILFSIGRTLKDFGAEPHRTLLYAALQLHL